jgi:hypothetical protein
MGGLQQNLKNNLKIYFAWRNSPPDVISHLPLLLDVAEKLKTKVHTDNWLPPSVLSCRLNHSSSVDRRVPDSRKSSTVWIRQHDKVKYHNKKILHCVRKLIKNWDKEAWKGLNFLNRIILRLSGGILWITAEFFYDCNFWWVGCNQVTQ